MSLKSLSFGLSEYALLKPTFYADNDATLFHETIDQFYLPSLNQIFLNGKLTKALMLKWFNDYSKDLGVNDTFYFFFAGHGCNYKNKPYISCYDSLNDDILTWVSVEELQELAMRNGCNKIIFFIDACQDDSQDGSNRGDLLDQLEIKESFKLQDINHYQLIFFSSSKGEKANIRELKKHGIWSYFLIQALRGDNEGKEALNANYHLYVNRLQEYLFLKVQDFYREIGKPPKQSAIIKGTMHIDPLIRIFDAPIAVKYEAVPENIISKIHFETIVNQDVRKLKGFNKEKGHKVPKKFDNYTNQLIKKFGENDVREIMENDSEKIVEIFDLDPNESIDNGGYELDLPSSDGCASFSCKYFIYTISLELDEDDLDNAILSFVLIPHDQDKLFQVSDSLDECFTHWFDCMIMKKGKINPKEIYSTIKKSSKDLTFKAKYKPADDELELMFEDGRAFNISLNCIRVNFKASERIHIMLESLSEVGNAILLIDSKTKLLG